jgi:hypothetical protein
MNDKLIKQKIEAPYFVLVALAATSFIVLGILTPTPVNALNLDSLANPTVVTDVHLPGDDHPAKTVSCNNGEFCILVSPSVVVPTGHETVHKNNFQSCDRSSDCAAYAPQNQFKGNGYINSGVHETLQGTIREFAIKHLSN